MTINSTNLVLSATLIDNYVWRVKLYMSSHYGWSVMEREVSPLTWYINTGRANTGFLHALIAKPPYMIGRLLHKGGSHDEAIDRIKHYIGYKEG